MFVLGYVLVYVTLRVLTALPDFIDAGAEVITTNSYSVVPRCLELLDDRNIEASIPKLLQAAGEAAREACRQRPDRNVKVAGCLPPLAESYRPDKVEKDFEKQVTDYRTITSGIAKHADLLLCETMSTALEAKAACHAALETGLPVWVAWTLDERKPVLRSGESITEAINALSQLEGQVSGYFFNCTSPEVISLAMKELHGHKGRNSDAVLGAYANGFVTATGGAGEYRKDLTPQEYLAFADDWAKHGATVIGGCCGIFPEHIAHLRAAKDARVGES